MEFYHGCSKRPIRGGTSVTPAPFATNVPVTGAGAIISATFSQAMSPATTDAAFTVTLPGGALVPGTATLSPNGLVATFTPSRAALWHTAPLTRPRLQTGNEPFRRHSAGCQLRLVFHHHYPAAHGDIGSRNGAIGVPVTQVITATFSEPMIVSRYQFSCHDLHSLRTDSPSRTRNRSSRLLGQCRDVYPWRSCIQQHISGHDQHRRPGPRHSRPFTDSVDLLNGPSSGSLANSHLHCRPPFGRYASVPDQCPLTRNHCNVQRGYGPDTINSATFTASQTSVPGLS